jgi:hypothetical protein
MYYTGIDPFTKEEVCVARNLRDRKMQRALMQFFKAESASSSSRPVVPHRSCWASHS